MIDPDLQKELMTITPEERRDAMMEQVGLLHIGDPTSYLDIVIGAGFLETGEVCAVFSGPKWTLITGDERGMAQFKPPLAVNDPGWPAKLETQAKGIIDAAIVNVGNIARD